MIMIMVVMIMIMVVMMVNFDKDGWDCIDKMTLMQITRDIIVQGCQFI